MDEAPSQGDRKHDGWGSLLLVERDRDLRKAIGLCLRENGWRILCAADASEAFTLLQQESPEVLVVSVGPSPEWQGRLIQSFRNGRRSGRRGFAVVTADQHLEETWRETYRPDAVVFKPFDVGHLSRRILRLMDIQHGGGSSGENSTGGTP
jgi:DNA-binding response OmpR family regulator